MVIELGCSVAEHGRTIGDLKLFQQACVRLIKLRCWLRDQLGCLVSEKLVDRYYFVWVLGLVVLKGFNRIFGLTLAALDVDKLVDGYSFIWVLRFVACESSKRVLGSERNVLVTDRKLLVAKRLHSNVV